MSVDTAPPVRLTSARTIRNVEFHHSRFPPIQSARQMISASSNQCCDKRPLRPETFRIEEHLLTFDQLGILGTYRVLVRTY